MKLKKAVAANHEEDQKEKDQNFEDLRQWLQDALGYERGEKRVFKVTEMPVFPKPLTPA